MRRLIVVVPGLSGKESYWTPLIERLAKEPELAGSEWFFWEHNVWRSFGLRKAARLAAGLQARLDQKWASAGGYDDVILIGHSMGGILLRQAYLLASGDKPGARRSLWQSRVSKIVLFAATNRGADVGRKLGLGPLAGLVNWTGSYSWMPFSDFLRGSDFITNLRIRWVRYFRKLDPRPVVIQFLGDEDTVVEASDSVDVEQFPEGFQFQIAGANHSSLYRIDQAAGEGQREERYGLIRQGVLRPEALVQTDKKLPTGVEVEDRHQKVIFVLHGIRDSANDWVQSVCNYIARRDPTAVTIAPNQGYLSLLGFLSSTRRRRPSRSFKDAYSQCVAKFPDAEFHFIGHSNGTYQLGRCLADVPEMTFDRVALASSVLPPDYPWDERFTSGQVQEMQNHMALKDFAVGWVCNALRGIGMRDVGTGGYTGFERTGMWTIKPVAYYEGGHGAPVEPTDLFNLADYVLGLPQTNPAPTLRQPLPHWRRWISRSCLILAPLLVAAYLVLPILLLTSVHSWLGPLALVIAHLIVLFIFFVY